MPRIAITLAAAVALTACKAAPRPAAAGSDSAGAALPAASAQQEAPAKQEAAAKEEAPAKQEPPIPKAPANRAGSAGTLEPVAREHAGGTTILRAVRVSPGAAPTLAFEFDARVPSYSVRYLDAPPQECGSGDEVRLPGGARLVVAFRNAAAHDDAGHATVADRDRTFTGGDLLALRLFCDFEGDVSWAAALRRKAPFRVTELDSPPRLVVRFDSTGER